MIYLLYPVLFIYVRSHTTNLQSEKQPISHILNKSNPNYTYGIYCIGIWLLIFLRDGAFYSNKTIILSFGISILPVYFSNSVRFTTPIPSGD